MCLSKDIFMLMLLNFWGFMNLNVHFSPQTWEILVTTLYFLMGLFLYFSFSFLF